MRGNGRERSCVRWRAKGEGTRMEDLGVLIFLQRNKEEVIKAVAVELDKHRGVCVCVCDQ